MTLFIILDPHLPIEVLYSLISHMKLPLFLKV